MRNQAAIEASLFVGRSLTLSVATLAYTLKLRVVATIPDWTRDQWAALLPQQYRSVPDALTDLHRMAADLECVDDDGKVVLAVEVKERTLTLTDVEGTLRKGRQRKIKDIFFSTPGVRNDDQHAIEERINRAFASGQNLYVFDFFELARSVLALGGEPIRFTFIKQVGEHLDVWNTQPIHRQAWKRLLERL